MVEEFLIALLWLRSATGASSPLPPAAPSFLIADLAVVDSYLLSQVDGVLTQAYFFCRRPVLMSPTRKLWRLGGD